MPVSNMSLDQISEKDAYLVSKFAKRYGQVKLKVVDYTQI